MSNSLDGFVPRDAYFATHYRDKFGHDVFSSQEADIADPTARIVIFVAFTLPGNIQVEGYYDPDQDIFKVIMATPSKRSRRNYSKLYKAAMATIEHFVEKLCAGPKELVGQFTRMQVPLIRKMYPGLVADNLIGVQPMRVSSSLLYYMRFRYASAKNG